MAAKNGIKFMDNLLLNKININNNKVSNVELIDCHTNRIVKRIDCQYFVNSANNYLTRLIAKRCPTRVRIPTLCVYNQLMVTKPFDGLVDSSGSDSIVPIIHDFDQKFTVYQTSDRSLCLTVLSENDRNGGLNTELPEIHENWDDFYRILKPILERIPALSAAKLHKLVARLE
ncbi:unnamed protein product, partial [Oppiella nova]